MDGGSLVISASEKLFNRISTVYGLFYAHQRKHLEAIVNLDEELGQSDISNASAVTVFFRE